VAPPLQIIIGLLNHLFGYVGLISSISQSPIRIFFKFRQIIIDGRRPKTLFPVKQERYKSECLWAKLAVGKSEMLVPASCQ